MKFNLTLFAVLLIGSLTAQVEAELEDLDALTNYPANNVSDDDLIEAFYESFQPSNVGNMHVYASAQPDDDDFFNGEELGIEMRRLFSNRTKRGLGSRQPYAVAKIRGEAEQLFLMRHPDRQGNPSIVLYDLRNGSVDPVMTLATTKCRTNGSCQQTDSWIQDVDGDTRLDIIQKRGTVRDGSVMRERTMVYRQFEDGSFRRDRSLEREVDADSYRMEMMR